MMRVPLRSKIITEGPASMTQTRWSARARPIPKRMPRNSTAPVLPTFFTRISSVPAVVCAGWPGRIGLRCRIPRLLRGGPAGKSLMGPLGVVDDIELVHLRLQFLKRFGEGLFVEVAEQGLVEAFVLALRGRLVGLPGDRLHPERGDVSDQLPQHPASGRVQRRPVIAEQPLRNTVCGDAFADDRDRALGRFTPGNMRRDREAGVIIDELEDHTLPPTSQNIFGAVELPTGVRRRIDEPTVRRPRFLLRLHPRDAGVAEDPRQRRRRRDRDDPQLAHLVMNADRTVIQARLLQRDPHPDRLLLHLVDRLLRTRPRSSRARLKRCRLTLLKSAPLDRRTVRDVLRHNTRIIWLIRARKARKYGQVARARLEPATRR